MTHLKKSYGSMLTEMMEYVVDDHESRQEILSISLPPKTVISLNEKREREIIPN